MSEEELIETFDKLANSSMSGTNFFMEEIRYREANRLSEKVVNLTRWIVLMTFVVTVATIINVIVFLNDSPSIPGFIQ